mmetsp:Transcript_58882/g.140238  ORF Transcript_58882/g.140238 Transcript_58882/m.140238 type:complete len:288 (-) Transcript_58882:713-1576(-)
MTRRLTHTRRSKATVKKGRRLDQLMVLLLLHPLQQPPQLQLPTITRSHLPKPPLHLSQIPTMIIIDSTMAIHLSHKPIPRLNRLRRLHRLHQHLLQTTVLQLPILLQAATRPLQLQLQLATLQLITRSQRRAIQHIRLPRHMHPLLPNTTTQPDHLRRYHNQITATMPMHTQLTRLQHMLTRSRTATHLHQAHRVILLPTRPRRVPQQTDQTKGTTEHRPRIAATTGSVRAMAEMVEIGMIDLTRDPKRRLQILPKSYSNTCKRTKLGTFFGSRPWIHRSGQRAIPT